MDATTTNHTDRDFLLLERVTCKNYPLHQGGEKRMPVIISAIHYNSKHQVIALSVFEIPEKHKNSQGYLKDLAADETYYESNGNHFPPHFIDTNTETTLPISAFDTERDFMGVLQIDFLPDIILRRTYAITRHPVKNDRSFFDTSTAHTSETLFNNDEIHENELDLIQKHAEHIVSLSPVIFPPVGTWNLETRWTTIPKKPALSPRP